MAAYGNADIDRIVKSNSGENIMDRLNELVERIIQRVNINLREPLFDAGPYVRGLIPWEKMIKFYAFYGITQHHPFNFDFCRSNLAGSYFLGKCRVSDSILYKSDIRGDELKRKGEIFQCEGFDILLHEDETINIKDSCLIKTLIHNNSHDPECPEEFTIRNTISTHYANIHGSDVEGCFMGPFSTVDLTTLHDCVIGEFVYLQKKELAHHHVPAGTIWVSAGESFEFHYQHDPEILKNYIRFEPGDIPQGIFMDFVEDRKEDFQRIFDAFNLESFDAIPASASLNRYAVIKPKMRINDNVLISQRAYVENSYMGMGANAQENCFIINSWLSGYNVTAHGAKIINAVLGENVFVGFNSFLRGTDVFQLQIGENSIIMPHTIIDLTEPVTINPSSVVWGFIRNQKDVEENSVPISTLEDTSGEFSLGRMRFNGNGKLFTEAFKHRINHILEANGAYFDGTEEKRGHAQQSQKISYNIIQPYPEGINKGLYPTISILP
jgi:carbonic anhydrase/acetyltransferase-like protein (isoleucine patch superfamily)